MYNLKKAIINIQALYPNDKSIFKIIKMCGLVPTDKWSRWTDNGGNILCISKHKVLIKKIKNTNTLITDVYFKSSLSDISKISRWAMISFAENGCVIWFIGDDDRLRVLVNKNKTWESNKFPLSSGLKIFKFIITNMKFNFKSFDSNFEFEGLKLTKTWVSRWYPSSCLIEEMFAVNEELASLTLKECGVI
jgi:hypothetical protein